MAEMVQPKKVAGGAFGQFLNEKRPELQAQCKGQPITAITKLASEKFKALSAEDKAIYEEKYQAAKAKYDEDMKAFLDAGGEKKVIQRKGKKGDKKKKKDPQAPKKPAGGAYGCFLAKNREAFQKQCKGMPMTAVTKLASEKYKALSAKDKTIYEEKYQAAKAKYEKDMKAFLDAGGEKKAIQRKGKKGDKKKKKDPEAPKKPAGGAYGCFMAKNRKAFQEQTKGQPATAVSKMGAAKWKELSDDDKKIYEEEYQKKKEAYEEAKKSYVPLSNEGESDEPPAKKRKTKEEKEADKQSKAAEKAAEKEAAKAAKAAKAQAKAEAKAAKGKAEAKPKATAKAKAKNAPKSPGVKMDSAVVAKAEKLGYKDTLLKLAAHHEVIASGKSQSEMLQALEQKGGLLHPARRALLGA